MTPDLLTTWHAIPVSQRTALQQLLTVRHQLKHARADYQVLRIAETQARFWVGRDISGDIKSLIANADSESEQAYLHLLYGQVLMSCKLNGAMEQLDLGFKLAATIFAKADYLIVMRRHDALRPLVLSNQRSKPLTLNELIQEAAIITQLKGNHARDSISNASRNDTVG